MKRFMMSVTDEMYKELEKQQHKRQLPSIQETVRNMLVEKDFYRTIIQESLNHLQRRMKEKRRVDP